MSTSYYELRAPWSSIRVDEIGQHTRIHMWAAGKKAGELVVGPEHLSEALWGFRQDPDNSYGCNATVVSRNEAGVLHIRARPRSRVVISEYSEIIEWDELLDSYPAADGRTITDADRWEPRS